MSSDEGRLTGQTRCEILQAIATAPERFRFFQKGRVMTECCPCGSTAAYADCCAPLLDLQKRAATAEALMRSRYVAYVRNDMVYLEKTQFPLKRGTFNARKTLAWNADVVWTGLRILATREGGTEDAAGVVEFVASFEKAGEPGSIHEVSRFKQQDGRWFYVDGRVGVADKPDAPDRVAGKPKVGRNAPCPCGSGKKFKRCCG
jgi:SEC-C motif domain protein